jgi:hypothetical protein
MNTLQELQQELKALSDKVDKALNNEQQPTIQPFDGTKRVRIDKASSADYWYSHRVSEVFEVKYCRKEYYALSDKDYLYIYPQDCTEVEPKPQQPWEKYPTFESCWSHMDKQYNVLLSGDITEGRNATDALLYNYPTEALAKYARAVMILSTVAKKWNEGVGIKHDVVWFAATRSKAIKRIGFVLGSDFANTIPFHFHSEEHLQKCIELFPEEWKDFFNAKG